MVQKDPTEILQKWSYRIVIEMILQDPDKEILHKCPHNRDLVQVLLQDPDTSGPKDPHTEILKHRSCTSCPTGS